MVMNRLLLAIILLIGITTSAKALGDDNNTNEDMHGNSGGITRLSTDFFTLMNRLKDDMPLSRQKIMSAGFELKSSRISSMGLRIIKVNPVELNDGTILTHIELREPKETFDKDTFFTLTIKARKFTRNEVDRKIGHSELVMMPMGHSKNETFGYRMNIDKYQVRTSYTQQEADILKIISFDSDEKSQEYFW